MNEQLAPCPVCNAPCELGDATELNLDDDYTICAGEMCGYSATVKRHAELCRHAEIGRLVEEMIGSVDTETPALMIAHNVMSLTFTVATGKPHAEAATLLDALRALAAKLGLQVVR